MIEISWKNYEAEIERRRDLDTKASLLVSTAVLLVIISINNGFESSRFLYLTYLYIIGIFFIILAAMFGIFSLWLRKYSTPDTWKIINEFKDKEFIEQIRGLVITLSDTQKDFMEKNSKKVRFLKIGYLSLLIGFLLLIPKKMVFYFI
ncbi:MAG: hypothetical protein K8R46_09720 [Pirellulales bacterium]|nr:hypothetical protein [Pirellulales bacterium]